MRITGCIWNWQPVCLSLLRDRVVCSTPSLSSERQQAQKNQPKRIKNFFFFEGVQPSTKFIHWFSIITKKRYVSTKRNSHNNNHSYDKKNDVDLGSFADNMLLHAKYLCWWVFFPLLATWTIFEKSLFTQIDFLLYGKLRSEEMDTHTCLWKSRRHLRKRCRGHHPTIGPERAKAISLPSPAQTNRSSSTITSTRRLLLPRSAPIGLVAKRHPPTTQIGFG